MKELVILSGKGGTGKTSVTASLAALAEQPVLADCDVDASNLPLVMDPQVQQRKTFNGGLQATIDSSRCTGCGKCSELCRFGAIFPDGPPNGLTPRTFRVESSACEGCGVCARFCTAHVIRLALIKGGEWFVSKTRFGPLIHARLQPGQGNSGKLVTIVREHARQVAGASGHPLILIDGPPGVGCPVIASLTGVSFVLAVTEPTPSGAHDLERVLTLARHFAVPPLVCVNKHDLNPAMTAQIEHRAMALGAAVVGRIPYDPAVTAAQQLGQTILEHGRGPAAEAIIQLWKHLSQNYLNPTFVHSQPTSAH